MPKIKIQAGAEIDVMSHHEARQVIAESRASWVAEISKGVSYPRFHAQGRVTAAGQLVIGGPNDPQNDLGPREGFVWDVRRLKVYGHAAGDELGLYVGDMNPSQLVGTTKDVVGSLFAFQTSLILTAGEELVIGSPNATTPAGTYVTVTGQARELPASLVWRLGGGA